jgi:hypothetical protein
MSKVARLALWERIGRLDSSYPGTPIAAGSIVQCDRCGGRGWSIAWDLVWHGGESSPTEDCATCATAGQFVLPPSADTLKRLAGPGGELPQPLALYEEDDLFAAAARPRRVAPAISAA